MAKNAIKKEPTKTDGGKMEKVIDVQDISYSYKKGAKAVDGISFHIGKSYLLSLF